MVDNCTTGGTGVLTGIVTRMRELVHPAAGIAGRSLAIAGPNWAFPEHGRSADAVAALEGRPPTDAASGHRLRPTAGELPRSLLLDEELARSIVIVERYGSLLYPPAIERRRPTARGTPGVE